MSLKIYKYKEEDRYKLYFIGQSDSEGCIIGSGHSNYPIGHFESNWGGFQPLPKGESILIKTDKKGQIFTDGENIIISHKRNGKGSLRYTLITKSRVLRIDTKIARETTDETIIHYNGKKFKSISKVKFKQR